MSEKQPAVFTFHKIREQGEQGEPGAWRAFLEFYSPLYLHLGSLYAPAGEQASGVWEKTLGGLAADNFARFRATSRQSEREFLSDVRALLLDQAGSKGSGGGGDAAAVNPDAAPEAAAVNTDAAAVSPDAARVNVETLGLEKLGKIVGELPLLHQEMLFFKLAGYTDATLELVLRVAPRVAQASFERLSPDFAAARTLDQRSLSMALGMAGHAALRAGGQDGEMPGTAPIPAYSRRAGELVRQRTGGEARSELPALSRSLDRAARGGILAASGAGGGSSTN